MCWECKLKAIREREAMELTFTKDALDFLASFRSATFSDLEEGHKGICYRIGLVRGVIWLAMELEDNITSADVQVICHEPDEDTKILVYCDSEDLEIFRGTEVDFELHGLGKRLCFKDPRFGRVLFAGDMHPALEKEND